MKIGPLKIVKTLNIWCNIFGGKKGVKKIMDKFSIIKLKEEGNSNRQVAKLLHIDRKTVASYWNDYLDQKNKLQNTSDELKIK